MTLFTRETSTICIALLITLFCLTGCQSTASPHAGNNNPASSTDLQAYAAKQQDYEQLLQEWQTLKPGLSRLLAIEEELHLLLGQLEQLSTSLAENQTNTAISATPVPGNTTSNTPAALAAPEYTSPAFTQSPTPVEVTSTIHTEQNTAKNANYALQVASITEQHQLPLVWQEMRTKNPQLLANMEANVQKTQVKNTDYYRLKLGSFNTQQEASNKCSNLKAAGLPCLVVNYTGSNFAQLAN